MAATQGWHLLPSTPTRIAASLACGHCPPATAEIKHGLRASCQASTSLQQWLRGLSSLPMASAMSTSVCGAPVLESVGALPAAVISWPGGSNKVWGLRRKRRESLSNLEAPPPYRSPCCVSQRHWGVKGGVVRLALIINQDRAALECPSKPQRGRHRRRYGAGRAPRALIYVQSDDAVPDSHDCHPADQGLADAVREDWREVEANFRPPTLQRRRLRARAPVCLPTPGSDF